MQHMETEPGESSGARLTRERVAALDIPCGTCATFKTEVYLYDNPILSAFWVLRWAISYLGGNKSRNFIGQSSPTWRNKVEEGLDLLESDDTGEPENHLLSSSWSTLHSTRYPAKRKAAEDLEDAEEAVDCKAEMETPEVPIQDFCISTFGLLFLLTGWCAKGARSNSTWNLEAAEFRARCQNVVNGICSMFVVNREGHSKEAGGFRMLLFSDERRQVFLKTSSLVASNAVKDVAKTFAGRASCPVDEAFICLLSDSVNKNLSKKRREAAAQCHSELCWFIHGLVNQSATRKDALWDRLQLHQLEQLRTGYC